MKVATEAWVSVGQGDSLELALFCGKEDGEGHVGNHTDNLHGRSVQGGKRALHVFASCLPVTNLNIFESAEANKLLTHTT